MEEDIIFYQKYNGRSKGKRFNVRSSNTLKHPKTIDELHQSRSREEFVTKTCKKQTERTKSQIDDGGLQPHVPYSLHRKKRWLLVEELQKIDNKNVDEDTRRIQVTSYTGHARFNRRLESKNKQRKPKSPPEEEEVKLVKSRKGVVVKKKRKKGKKGVQQRRQESGLFEEADEFYHVQLAPKKNCKSLHVQDDHGYISPDFAFGWVAEKNFRYRRRQRAKCDGEKIDFAVK